MARIETKSDTTFCDEFLYESYLTLQMWIQEQILGLPYFQVRSFAFQELALVLHQDFRQGMIYIPLLIHQWPIRGVILIIQYLIPCIVQALE